MPLFDNIDFINSEQHMKDCLTKSLMPRAFYEEKLEEERTARQKAEAERDLAIAERDILIKAFAHIGRKVQLDSGLITLDDGQEKSQ